MTTFANLFTPLTVRGRTIPNRIVSTPHATGWELPGGLISDKEVDYHVRKAAGGVGLVMTFGSATVDPTTAASYGSIALWDPRNEPQLRRIADGCTPMADSSSRRPPTWVTVAPPARC